MYRLTEVIRGAAGIEMHKTRIDARPWDGDLIYNSSLSTCYERKFEQRLSRCKFHDKKLFNDVPPDTYVELGFLRQLILAFNSII